MTILSSLEHFASLSSSNNFSIPILQGRRLFSLFRYPFPILPLRLPTLWNSTPLIVEHSFIYSRRKIDACLAPDEIVNGLIPVLSAVGFLSAAVLCDTMFNMPASSSSYAVLNWIIEVLVFFRAPGLRLIWGCTTFQDWCCICKELY